MYSRSAIVYKYLHYYLTASNSRGHGIHSPFIFHFITKVLNDKNHYPAYDMVEQLRNQLLKDQTVLNIEDFGAGSSINKTNQRTIAAIVKRAAKPKKYGQLLYRIVKEYQPQTIVELGTSLGITTSYLALGNQAANIITLEGAEAVAAKAENIFQQLSFSNLPGRQAGIRVMKGNFDNMLPSVIRELPSPGLVFIDGNHRRESTERYFQQLLTKIHNDSILIFDDIHWSREMEQAWDTIRQHPSVRCSIDLFFIGIVLFRNEFREKQHFTIRF
jgi:predicted O-methyltransferase YrrM